MIAYEEFLSKYRITPDEMAESGFTWDDLVAMHEDFRGKVDTYKSLLASFQREYLEPLLASENDERPVVHSLHSRVKDPEHLIAKAVRKKLGNYRKYEPMGANNYERFFTDLAGVRCLLLFKADWRRLHEHLLAHIPDDPERYVSNDCLGKFDPDPTHTFHAEAPKVHIRNGDDDKLYLQLLGPGQVSKGKVYRSAHYIVKYRGIYLEIQARTLFEESWGEIDHAIVYPYHTDDPLLKEYTELLNRLTGLADEMASFFVRIEKLESQAASSVLAAPTTQGSVRAAGGQEYTALGVDVSGPQSASGIVTPSGDAGMSLSNVLESIVRSE